MDEQQVAWGKGDRYYAAATTRESGYGQWDRHWLTAMLAEHAPDLRARVDRTFKQWNQILREYLRGEMALRLTVGEDARSIPVRVADGLPAPLAEAMGQDATMALLLLNGPLLERTTAGLRLITEKYNTLSALPKMQPVPATPDEIAHALKYVECLAVLAKKSEVSQRIGKIEQDILGAYFFLVPQVELYWMAIGLVAAALDVSAEALTVVVLTHELAHAYTHLGRDIDGVRWQTGSFAQTETAVVEGLAQFYTEVVCGKLTERFPAAKIAFDRLLGIQSSPYTAYRSWMKNGDSAGELVRAAMVQTRSGMASSHATFVQKLETQRGHFKLSKAGCLY